jgi:cyanophycin synthetase
VRLVEIRLLDGPNIYRLEPTVRLELAVGRRRSWYGQRMPGRHGVVRLGAAVPARRAPRPIGELADWVRRLHRRALKRRVPVTIHRTSEPGHWVVCFPWREQERAETLARAALRLTEAPGPRTLERAVQRIAQAGSTPPEWITDDVRGIPLISVSGTNGKSTTTRMIAHILSTAGQQVGMTTTDGVFIGGRLIEEGDYTGPLGAQAVMGDAAIEVGVLETARGGILLRGLGYESNDASVLTNVSADHLDLQGLHTVPELAEVKSVIARVTRRDGVVVLNADDPLIAGVARWVRAPVCLFSLRPTSSRIRRHLAAGGRALVLNDGWLTELAGRRRARIVAVSDVPSTFGGIARHNVANALAATGGALAMGASHEQVAAGLSSFAPTSEHMPGRLNLYRLGNRLVIVDFAHNEAGLSAVLDMAEALVGRRGRRKATVSLIVGTGGDRPDDAMRALGRMAAERADQVAIKETLRYLRGRSRQSMVGEIMAGARAGGARRVDVAVYEKEPEAVREELTTAGRLSATDDGTPRVLIVMCHEDRLGVEDVLRELGATTVIAASALADMQPL